VAVSVSGWTARLVQIDGIRAYRLPQQEFELCGGEAHGQGALDRGKRHRRSRRSEWVVSTGLPTTVVAPDCLIRLTSRSAHWPRGGLIEVAGLHLGRGQGAGSVTTTKAWPNNGRGQRGPARVSVRWVVTRVRGSDRSASGSSRGDWSKIDGMAFEILSSPPN